MVGEEPPAGEGASGEAPMKRCPDCAELVQPDARICRFCRYDFETRASGDKGTSRRATPQQEPEPRGFVATYFTRSNGIALAIVVVVLLVLYGVVGCHVTATPTA